MRVPALQLEYETLVSQRSAQLMHLAVLHLYSGILTLR